MVTYILSLPYSCAILFFLGIPLPCNIILYSLLVGFTVSRRTFCGKPESVIYRVDLFMEDPTYTLLGREGQVWTFCDCYFKIQIVICKIPWHWKFSDSVITAQHFKRTSPCLVPSQVTQTWQFLSVHVRVAWSSSFTLARNVNLSNLRRVEKRYDFPLLSYFCQYNLVHSMQMKYTWESSVSIMFMEISLTCITAAEFPAIF